LLLHIDKCRMTIARSTSGIFVFSVIPCKIAKSASDHEENVPSKDFAPRVLGI